MKEFVAGMVEFVARMEEFFARMGLIFRDVFFGWFMISDAVKLLDV